MNICGQNLFYKLQGYRVIELILIIYIKYSLVHAAGVGALHICKRHQEPSHFLSFAQALVQPQPMRQRSLDLGSSPILRLLQWEQRRRSLSQRVPAGCRSQIAAGRDRTKKLNANFIISFIISFIINHSQVVTGMLKKIWRRRWNSVWGKCLS